MTFKEINERRKRRRIKMDQWDKEAIFRKLAKAKAQGQVLLIDDEMIFYDYHPVKGGSVFTLFHEFHHTDSDIEKAKVQLISRTDIVRLKIEKI